jgi:hypothetical protein
MSASISRTVTASELRDPEILAEAGRTPIGVFDGRRQESLVLTSRASFDADQRLHYYMGLLANAVVEIGRDDPSPVALGEAGYVADWSPADRAWWLRGFAEVIAASAADDNTAAIAGFIAMARDSETALPTALETEIDASRFSVATAAKLKPRP